MRTPIWFVLAAFVLVPSAAYAQASITGVVRDTSGAVLPGVTVEAASPALIEKTRTVVTDGTGQYRIVDLRPGAYIVTFTLAGFSTVKREGVELTGSFTATVNAELRVGALEETITVTAESPVVDVQSVAKQVVLDHEVIDVIPTGKSERNLAVLVPGVVNSRGTGGLNQDVGGVLGDSQTSMVVHGSKGDSQRITINGVSFSVLLLGQQNTSSQINSAAFQEMTIDTGAVSAETGQGGVRMNLIPRDGGNTFTGTFFGAFANGAMQGDNYTQDLKDRGLSSPNSIKRLWDVNPGLGGRIKRDRLWFYTSARHDGAWNYVGGMFYNQNANNPNAWTFIPDPSRPASNENTFKDGYLRLTWQATARNKIAGSWDEQVRYGTPESITATVAPEATYFRQFPIVRNVAVDWTSPVTNRLLLEASILKHTSYTAQYGFEVSPLMIGVTDQGLGNLTYRARSTPLRATLYAVPRYRAAMSYVTGAHLFKVGFNNGSGFQRDRNYDVTQPFNYRFNNGVPNQITIRATPTAARFNQDADLGLYAQDKWTLSRLTLSYGMRFDYYKSSFPEQRLEPGPLVPTRNLTFPEAPGLAWKDILPRSGAVYDLFGDGKTAVKASLNKYVAGQGTEGIFGFSLGPVGRVVLTTTRAWNDVDRNFVPNCDLTSPVANGECGAMADRNFGNSVSGSTYDPETLTGWGRRSSNWEFSTGVQHELLPRVAMDVSYFRRWYGNFAVTDNRAVAPSDYTAFSLTVPNTDPRLPTRGQVISGLFDLNPNKVGQVDNYITFADNYGKQIEHWNGVDVTINARPRPGVLLQGGLSTGRTVTDNCEIQAKLPEMILTSTSAPNIPYCHQETPFLTQVKLIGAYTISKIDVQVSVAVQSVQSVPIEANYAAPNAEVAASLGRSLSGNAANVTVNLVAPGTMYGERTNQVDVRFGKILRFNKTRTSLNVDLFNILNANTVLLQNNVFGGRTPWQQPQAILTARFVKLGVQFDF